MQGCLQLCNAFQRSGLLQSGAVYFAVMRLASLASACTRGKKPQWCMNMIVKPHSTRRQFIGRSALAMSVSALPLGAGPVHAAEPACARGSVAPAVRSDEYWAKRGDISLYLYRKRLSSDRSGRPAPPVLLLAHGSSVSSRPTFDLAVPGHDDYSMMETFAEFGFDVWTMDFEGYGRSSKSAGNSNVADGVEDLRAASAVISRETGQTAFHLYGESGGALRAGAFAMAEPQRLRRLVLSAFTWTGKGSDTLTKRAEGGEYYRTHDTRPRDREMIRSIFTRDSGRLLPPGSTSI
jgi:pimeloyl-ACP methyl ester carboxylesterase